MFYHPTLMAMHADARILELRAAARPGIAARLISALTPANEAPPVAAAPVSTTRRPRQA